MIINYPITLSLKSALTSHSHSQRHYAMRCYAVLCGGAMRIAFKTRASARALTPCACAPARRPRTDASRLRPRAPALCRRDSGTLCAVLCGAMRCYAVVLCGAMRCYAVLCGAMQWCYAVVLCDAMHRIMDRTRRFKWRWPQAAHTRSTGRTHTQLGKRQASHSGSDSRSRTTCHPVPRTSGFGAMQWCYAMLCTA